jgi:uncharacterized RDD family membrane protein YckC
MAYAQSEADTPIHGLFSPEGVRLDLPVAGPAPRILAYGIDVIIVDLLLVLLFVVLFASFPIARFFEKWLQAAFREATQNVRAGRTGPASIGGLEGLLVAAFVLVQYSVELGYFIFWEMVTNGRSPGKVVVGLRVVRRNGLPIGFRSSVVRNVMRIVDMLPVDYVVGLVSMVVSASGERVGDHVAGTIVIRLDRPEPALPIAPGAESTALVLTREQLARIGPRELQLIRTTLRRASSLSEERRAPLLDEIAETMRARLDLNELPSDRGAFLRDVLAMAERYSHRESD